MLPHDGRGSLTPNPKIPRLASARMKTGIEIQNWASRIGFRLGSMWMVNNLQPRQPAAFAWRMNSESRRLLTPEHTRRAEAAHPSRPKSEKVIKTDVVGGVLSGSTARTVINRNSQGMDMKRSVNSMA